MSIYDQKTFTKSEVNYLVYHSRSLEQVIESLRNEIIKINAILTEIANFDYELKNDFRREGNEFTYKTLSSLEHE